MTMRRREIKEHPSGGLGCGVRENVGGRKAVGEGGSEHPRVMPRGQREMQAPGSQGGEE